MSRSDVSALAMDYCGFSLKPQMEYILPIIDSAIEMAVREGKEGMIVESG